MSVSQNSPSPAPAAAPQPQAAPAAPQAAPAPTAAQSALQLLKARDAALAAQPAPGADPVKQEPAVDYGADIRALKAQIESYEAERQESKRQAAMENELARITKTLSPTDFPLITKLGPLGSHKVVLDQMVAHYQATGDWVSEAVAAKAVEEQLKNLATQFAPAQPQVAPPPSHSWELPAPTLTSDMSGDVTRQLDSNPDPQRWNQEAMAMLRRAQNR